MDFALIILLSVLPILVIAAGLNDLTTMTIPNWISLALMVGFVPAAFAVGLPLGVIALHFGVALAALFIGAGLFALRFLGGGDAKLMAAVCLWLGTAGAPAFVLMTAVAGGLFSLGLLMVRGVPGIAGVGGPPWMGRLLQPKGDIPYGIAIAIGALSAFPSSDVVRAFVGG
ncbi:MAG: prepilin peptidase [Caulobacterales bacterium]|nr:prepilin peptidase [Caulobacterales bacterium]